MYDHVLSPTTIAGVPVKNRVVRAAHATGAPWLDRSDDMLHYHEARARGGVALTILEASGVHRTSPSAIPVYADRCIEGLSRLSSMADEHDMRLFIQLWHGGSAAAVNRTRGPRWSASAVPNVYREEVPREMTSAMIEEIRESFVKAAQRVKAAGLHGLELHAGHGYLFSQFLSPATNRREDEYGGNLENRTRFLREVLADVRSAVGADFPVGVRLSAHEGVPTGMNVDDTVAVAATLEGLVDFVDLTLGSYGSMHLITGNTDQPLGYQLPTSTQVGESLGVPKIVTGRVMTLQQADDIVASGAADLVSMVRALIADPELVDKARRGKEEEIRPCTSSNQGCAARVMTGRTVSCVVNPAANAEARVKVQKATSSQRRRIVVVGGGLAGMQAAKTAAEAGHDVTLLEMSRRLGGQAVIAAQAPYREDGLAIVQWLEAEVRRLGVDVRLARAVDDEMVMALSPDLVVCATGSLPRTDGLQLDRPDGRIPGIDLPHVIDAWQAMNSTGASALRGSVVIFDDRAEHEGLAVADHVALTADRLTYVTRHASLAVQVDAPEATAELSIRRVLTKADVLGHCELVAVTPESVQVQLRGTDRSWDIAADTLIRVGVNEPQRELADVLIEAGLQVEIVGDANGSADWLSAIHEGDRAAREVLTR